jgi:hypothetical protein
MSEKMIGHYLQYKARLMADLIESRMVNLVFLQPTQVAAGHN